MTKHKPKLTTQRAVEIYEEMLMVRREYYADTEFFKMPDVWTELVDESGDLTIKTFKSTTGDDYLLRAAVMIVDKKIRLNVDKQLWHNAGLGKNLDNFILAHEFAHLALDHVSNRGAPTNFFMGEKGGMKMILPPSLIEREADIGAVFFQCGIALMDLRRDVKQLADRAFTDIRHVEKARQYVLLDIFQRELQRQRGLRRLRPKYPTVIL